ncbi:MAG: hypothetical protein SX243_13265 [Acidobacteriota bacterium]|nr:hypothetical protein [Acidobacteriota bacterium]
MSRAAVRRARASARRLNLAAWMVVVVVLTACSGSGPEGPETPVQKGAVAPPESPSEEGLEPLEEDWRPAGNEEEAETEDEGDLQGDRETASEDGDSPTPENPEVPEDSGPSENQEPSEAPEEEIEGTFWTEIEWEMPLHEATDKLEEAKAEQAEAKARKKQAETVGIPAAKLEEMEAEEQGEDEFSLRELCRQKSPEDETTLDKSRRRVHETFCGATLWLDGLFGGVADVENAREVSGRIEVTPIYSEAEGTDVDVRVRVNYDLPTLENRVNVFFGRDDEEEFVQDRREDFQQRSSLFDVDRDEQWLAGFGYRPPGRWNQRLDFQVGGKLRSAPEIFAQGRWRRNVFVGERSVWRLRETVFWQNRDGFGSTTRVALDHLLSDKLLLRWSNIGTIHQESDGLEWRTTGLLYRNLQSGSALAYEFFIRGATEREVPLREYGQRGVYRRPLKDRWLFGELIVGYTWPREQSDIEREGSMLVGVSLELHFGRDPY